MLKCAPNHPPRLSEYKKVALRLDASSSGLHPVSSRLTSRYVRIEERSQRDQLCRCVTRNRLAALLAQRDTVAFKSAIMQHVSFGDSSKASTLKKCFLS
jgi:hypothetical protein